MRILVNTLSSLFHANKDRFLAGHYDVLFGDYFDNFSVYEEARGKIVVTLNYKASVLPDIAPHARHVDIFILKPGQALGPHFHKEASAEIHFLLGDGEAFIDNQCITFSKGTQTYFPASIIHDVSANADAETAVFISLQDNPILKPDGTLDYFDAEPVTAS